MASDGMEGFRQTTWSIARSLVFFALAAGGLIALFWLSQPTYHLTAPIPAAGGDVQLVVEGGKEFSSIVSMLTTLTTGLFVIIALVVRSPMRPNVRCPPGQAMLLTLFIIGASGAFFLAMHAKYSIAEGMLARSIDLEVVGGCIGAQAWFTAFAAAAAIALISETLMTFRKDANAPPT